MRHIRLIFVAVLFFSCTKEENDTVPIVKEYSLNGTLYESCDMEVVEGIILELRGLSHNQYDTTDATGSFNFIYQLNDQEFDLFMIDSSSSSRIPLMYKIPGNQNVSIDKVYILPSSNIEINLDVKNQYSSSDTLFFTKGSYDSFAGPFNSGKILEISPYFHSEVFYAGSEVEIGYVINRNGEQQYAHEVVTDYCNITKVSIVIE